MLRRTKNSGNGQTVKVYKLDTSSTTVHTTSAASTITTGSLVVLCVSFRLSSGVSVVSVTDNYGNKYVPAINTPIGIGPDETGGVYYAQNVVTGAAGTHTFTVTTSGSCAASIVVMEFAGAPATAAVEAQAYTGWDTAGTSHTGPSLTTNSGGFAVLGIIDNIADVGGNYSTYTFSSGGWDGGGTSYLSGSLNSNWGCNIFSKYIATPGTTVTTSWTTSASVRCAAWLLMIRPYVSRTVNESYSYDFSRQPNTTSFSNSRFKAYSTNGIRIDSGVASSNNGGELRIMDLDYVYNNSGTISSKVTVKGTRGYDVVDDEAGPIIVINSGPNMWKGYGARSLNTYQRLLRLDDPTTAWSGGGQIGLGSTTINPYANNDIVELRYTPANGSLQLLLNGTVLQSATDTTYSTANLSPGFWVNPYNHGGTGITDYTPSLTNPAIELVGTTAANTAGASYTTTFLFQNANDLAYDPAGYIADRTGLVTQATFGIYDWNGSNFLKLIPYDENLNRIGTSVATFSYTQGTGFITAQFDTPFNVVKGKKYFMAMATNSYIKAYGRGDGFSYSKVASGYTTIPSNLTSNTSSVGGIDRPIMFYSGNPIPSAMKMYANSAVKVTNIVEYQPFSVSDNFNRADGGLGSNWTSFSTPYSAPQIVSGQIVSAALSERAVYTASTFNNDQYSQCQVVNIGAEAGASPYPGAVLLVRSSNVSTYDGYIAVIYTNLLQIFKRVGGTSTQLTSLSTTTNNGSIVKLSAIGNVISIYVNGVLALSTTDSSISSGYPGLGFATSDSSGIIIDNWVGGNENVTTYDFNETNGTTIQTINPAFIVYGTSQTLQTLTGNLICTPTGGSVKALYNKGFKANQSSQVTKPYSNNRISWVGIHQQNTSGDDGYALYVSTFPTINLRRLGSVVGTYTASANAVENIVTAKLESVEQANGSLTINSYYNGSLIGSYTDGTPIPVGKPAFWIATNSGNTASDVVDQFIAGGEAPKSQLYANGTFVIGEYIEN